MTDPKRQRILVVDDDPSVLLFLQQVLEGEGYTVPAASSGEEALTWAQRESFDAALVDLVLPDINGLEVIRQLREQQPDPDIVTLVITGYPSIDSAMEAIDLKVDGYIIKPFSPSQLRLSVRNALESRAMKAENLRLCLEAERAQQLTAFYEATQPLISGADGSEALHQMLKMVALTLKADACTFRILDAKRQSLRLMASHGLDTTYHEQKPVVALGESVIGRVVEQRKTLVVSDITNKSPLLRVDLLIAEGLRSLLAVPVLLNEEVIGGLTVYWKSQREISPEDKRILYTLTNHIAAVFSNRQLFEDLNRANEQLRADLALAGQIQRGLTPRDLVTSHVEIAGYLQPASVLGGDMYNFFLLDDTTLVIYIADVANQGSAAAVSMVVLRSLLERYGRENLSPAQVLQQTNLALKEFPPKRSLEPMMLATAYYGILGLQSGVFQYANAAHERPFLWRQVTRTCEALRGDGFFLGLFDDGDYEDREVMLETGDMLVLYTDGIVDATNMKGERFTRSRMRQLVEENGCLPVPDFVDTIRTHVAQFASGSLLDDQALVVVRIPISIT